MAAKKKVEFKTEVVAVDPISEIIQERQKTHGSFTANANTFVVLDATMYNPDHNYNPTQQAAIAMIIMKLARIKSNPSVVEHWRDIQGYCQLVIDDLEF
jgi:hypothetical protein